MASWRTVFLYKPVVIHVTMIVSERVPVLWVSTLHHANLLDLSKDLPSYGTDITGGCDKVMRFDTRTW